MRRRLKTHRAALQGSLLLAYYYVSSAESYDIDWTTAQCVLCLRLIGFSFDYSDGSIRPEKRQPYQKKHALDRLPSVLEFLGYAYSYSGFLVGPQYSFATYSRFIGDLDKVSQHSIAFGAALKSFLFGAVYLGISTVGGGYFPVLALKGNDFLNVWPLWYRLVYVIAAMRVCLMRYGGIWMLTNGHCIMLGIGYAKGDDGRVRWDGLANFLPWRFETATNIDDLVGSFNINTNLWVKEYVFKRLRFLGNRELSLLGSLVFLAVWHGFSPGYFFNFGMEFLDQLAEARLRLLVRPLSNFASKTGGVVQMAWNFACYVTAFITLSFGFQAFELKTLEDSLNGYHAIGYISQLVPLFIIVLGIVLGPFLRERKPKAEGAKTE